MREQVSGPISFYTFRLLDPWPRLAHGAFARAGGVSRFPYDSLNISFSVQDDPESVRRNRGLLARAVGWDPEGIFSARQVHGRTAMAVERDSPGSAEAPEADALATDQPGVLLMMKFADCVPVTLWDPVRRVVALAHAGWRGTVLSTPAAALELMANQYGTTPANVLAGIGPSIGPCCYQVGPEVARLAAQAFAGTDVLQGESDGQIRLNLWNANAETLMRAGVAENNIEIAGLCTRCRNDLFFSHRAAGGPTGRFAVVAGIRARDG